MKSFFYIAAMALLGASNVAANVVARADYPEAALKYRGLKTLVYQGCYSSSSGLSLNSSYTYNTKGYCQGQCVPMNAAVQATSNRDECWCGNDMPPASAKVDDSKCSSTCTGYDIEMCGGDGFFSVYLTGTSTDVPNAGASSSAAHSSSTPKSSATVSASPSVVTIGGQTIVVTAPASQSSGSTIKSSGKGGPNKAAIAAGVVVGIVLIAAIAGGVFLYLRHRRRREVEEEYRRNAAVNSVKPPTSSAGASSFTDTRLDPSVMAQRRMSDGSIADNQDYSRRILKVTNA